MDVSSCVREFVVLSVEEYISLGAFSMDDASCVCGFVGLSMEE